MLNKLLVNAGIAALVWTLSVPAEGVVRRVWKPTADRDEFCYTWLMEINTLSELTEPESGGLLRQGMLTLYDALMESNADVSGSRAVGFQLVKRIEGAVEASAPSAGSASIHKLTGNGVIVRTGSACVAINVSMKSFPWVAPETSSIAKTVEVLADISDMLIISDTSSASCDPDVVALFRKKSKPVFAPEGILPGESGVTRVNEKDLKFFIAGSGPGLSIRTLPLGNGDDKGEYIRLEGEGYPPISICTSFGADGISTPESPAAEGGILIAPAWKAGFSAISDFAAPSVVISVGEHNLADPYGRRGFMKAAKAALSPLTECKCPLMIPGEGWSTELEAVSGIEEPMETESRHLPARFYDLNGMEIRDISRFSGIYIERRGGVTRKLFKKQTL